MCVRSFYPSTSSTSVRADSSILERKKLLKCGHKTTPRRYYSSFVRCYAVVHALLHQSLGDSHTRTSGPSTRVYPEGERAKIIEHLALRSMLLLKRSRFRHARIIHSSCVSGVVEVVPDHSVHRINSRGGCNNHTTRAEGI